MKVSKCPYCGEKVSYMSAIMEKEMGEHTCKKCGRNSTIYFVKSLKMAILLTIAVAVVILAVWYFMGNYENLWGMLWVFIPFVIFYACLPVFYRLVPLKIRPTGPQTGKKEKDPLFYNPKAASGSTKVIPKISTVSGEFTILKDDTDTISTKVIPVVTDQDIYGEEYMDISDLTNKYEK